jgi:O-antigen ligase
MKSKSTRTRRVTGRGSAAVGALPAGSQPGVLPTLKDAFGWCPRWIFLVMLSLLIPTEFSVALGTLRLSPYRIVLILAFLPAMRALATGKAGRFMLPDGLVLGHLIWSFIVYLHHHGMSVALETGGVRILEFGGAYLVARAYITDLRTFLGFCAVLVYCVLLLAPLALFESLTGWYPFKELVSALLGIPFRNTIEQRLGMWRAIGPFDHPILLGVFASSALGIVWALRSLPRFSRRGANIQIASVFTTTGMSLSAGPFMSLVVQCLLVIWRRFTPNMERRWRAFTVLMIIVYFVVDLISSRTPIRVFLTYLTFSAVSAYNRLAIFDGGIQDVSNNPIFGIGLNPWNRPSWMHSDSMDNFWLFQAVTFGIPGFLMLACAVISLLRRPTVEPNDQTSHLRIGWTFSVIGVILAGTTVHFWNSLFCYFGFLLGAGAWFSAVGRRDVVDARRLEPPFDK